MFDYVGIFHCLPNWVTVGKADDNKLNCLLFTLSEQVNQVIFKSYLDIGTKFYFAKRPLIGVKVMAFNGNIKIFTNNSIT